MKRFNLKHALVCVLVFLGSLVPFAASTQAAETPTRDLAVTPLFSADQAKKITNYFSVSGTGNHVFRARVTNSSDKPKKIVVELTDAISTQTGIQYTHATNKQVKKAYQLATYSQTPKRTIRLAARQSKVVSIPIKVPKAVKGTILGGLHYYEVAPLKAGSKTGKKQVSVHVHYRRDYVLAVAIHASKFPDQDAFYLKEATYRVYPSGSVVQTGFANESPAITAPKGFTYRVTKKDAKHALFHGKLEAIKAAPMTTGFYEVAWGAKRVTPGTYTIHFYAKGKEVAVRDFTIQAAKVEQLAKQNNQPIAAVTPWWVILLYMLLGAGIGLGVFYGAKRYQANKQAAKKQE